MKPTRPTALDRASWLFLAGMVSGIILGLAYAYFEFRPLNDALIEGHPNDSRDGIGILIFAYTMIGMITGAVVGLLAAVVFYFKQGRKPKLR